jgi:hypothetical protein
VHSVLDREQNRSMASGSSSFCEAEITSQGSRGNAFAICP